MNGPTENMGTGFRAQVEARLASLEKDMLMLESENERLRSQSQSAYLERDACIGLLMRLGVAQGLKAGRTERETALGTERRVILDLPGGQVTWDYLESEAHLFDWLPAYDGAIEENSVQETYARVMNPGL